MPLFEGHKDSGIERLFIEMPDHAKNEVIWKYPDAQIMQHSTVNVDVDYEAVFTNLGKVIGVLPPGRHQLSEGASVLFGWLVDRLTGNGYYDAEIYFVATRDIPGLCFGGPVDNLQDGPSGLVVSVRVFGELAYHVADPTVLLTKFAGSSGDVDHNQQIATWVEDQALAAIRAVLPDLTAGHGVLAMGQLQGQTAAAALAQANTILLAWGLAISSFAELNVNLPDEDAAQLKQLAATKAYTGIAGSFNDAVRGEAALEIARGVASGNVGAQQGLFAGVLLGGPGGLAPGGGLASVGSGPRRLPQPLRPRHPPRNRRPRPEPPQLRPRPTRPTSAPSAGGRSPRAPISARAAARPSPAEPL
jgi:membrane protease subunit (stomatin/prohibitin family)